MRTLGMDANPTAETTGIYEGPDGVRSFIKAENPVPPGYHLVEKVRRLNARAEVIAASDAAEPAAKSAKGGKQSAAKGKADPAAIENKMDDVDADKSDDIVDE